MKENIKRVLVSVVLNIPAIIVAVCLELHLVIYPILLFILADNIYNSIYTK